MSQIELDTLSPVSLVPGSRIDKETLRNYSSTASRASAEQRRAAAASSREHGSPIIRFSPEEGAAPAVPEISSWRATLVIANLTGVTFAASMSTGVLTVGLPRIASDLALGQSLLLWPASVYALTQGCCLLLVGSIADFAGNRSIYLAGCFSLGIFLLASGFSQTGIQMIIFRALSGIAVSLVFPTSVSIITSALPNGKRRNLGFSCIGLGQPLGYSVGLGLGGFLVDTVGWRVGFYMSAGASFLVFAGGFWALPKDRQRQTFSWQGLVKSIDWVGIVIASTSLGMLSFVFAMLTASTAHIHDASSIALITIALAMGPFFVFWMNRQEKLGHPTLIPNSLWRNKAFLTICLMVLLAWIVLQSMEYFFSLYCQQIQQLSATQTSVRLMPNVALGALTNLATGLFIHKIPANRLVIIASVISTSAPLIMALLSPTWSYWYAEFWAILLSPLAVDVLFTVSNIVITEVFPPETHALAGAVFNTIAQFGTSIGIAIMAVISSSVTDKSDTKVRNPIGALLEGYRAVFWTCLGSMVLACVVGLLGLKKIGKVGLKRE
ncbi:hypothetical protein MMC25_006133 [Agyrium rufum]|nr:hypothetical protein [Agyrium rufum]